MGDKVIISCAVTGSIHVPSMSPYLPITPTQIAQEAIAACEAGAGSVHLHARNPKTGAVNCAKMLRAVPVKTAEVFAGDLQERASGS